jgi:hypothetical protein
MPKKVKVHCLNGIVVEEGTTRKKGTSNYEFHPGDTCRIQPSSNRQTRDSNRRCVLTGDYSEATGKVRVQFLDSKTHKFVNPLDLIPDEGVRGRASVIAVHWYKSI